ncbi:unnamed protein product [Cuscuta campestris]|uniref:UBA domain-containing protein n=1 Tax=Cuscuta campestris TaxID=132261 RepID=A0A484KXY2_9ASTE|nr:unnamed protein product [Cuscuta campestris]
MLRLYRSDPTLWLPEETITLDDNLTYEEEPVQILALEVKQLRNKRVPLVEILFLQSFCSLLLRCSQMTGGNERNHRHLQQRRRDSPSMPVVPSDIKSSVGEASSTQATPLNTVQHPTSTGQSTQTVTSPPPIASVVAIPQSAPESAPTLPNSASSVSELDVYDQAVSNLVAGSTLESTIQEILEIGGGNWDREAVMCALRAAYNNLERAVDYLCSVSSFF